jgi:hypothetical protein
LTGNRAVALALVLILLARVLGLISTYFFEEDEVSLAVGAAALVAKTPGHLYRYAVQLGYYRLVELIDLVFASRIDAIPWIMKLLSALAGAVIPVAGFFAFTRELTIRRRWLIVLVLALNPIVWRSSQYGNDAIVSAAFSTVGLVMLSNPLRRSGRIIALACLGAAILIRADAVLLLPAAFLLLSRADGSVGRALRTTTVFVATMAAIYGALSLLDPRMDSVAQSLSSHMLSTPNPTMFWEYLLWAISPLPFVFAIVGFRRLLDENRALLVGLVVWCVPTLLFYFRATTTCRYFVNVAVPLSIAGAIGMEDLFVSLRAWMRGSVAWAAVLVAATLHLVIALGHVSPARPAELFYGGTFATHDGQMPTGALLARTYLTSGSLLRALPRPQFGAQSYPYWEGVAYAKAVERLAEPAAPDRGVVVLLSGGFSHAFHFHAHAAGARYLTGPPGGGVLWGAEIHFQLGHSRVMAIAVDQPAFAHLKRIDVQADDLLWMVGENPLPDADTLARLPPGLTVQPTETFDPHFRTFRLVRVEAAGR